METENDPIPFLVTPSSWARAVLENSVVKCQLFRRVCKIGSDASPPGVNRLGAILRNFGVR
jgi:hypothetical protein